MEASYSAKDCFTSAEVMALLWPPPAVVSKTTQRNRRRRLHHYRTALELPHIAFSSSCILYPRDPVRRWIAERSKYLVSTK